jgi:hypothetical protein
LKAQDSQTAGPTSESDEDSDDDASAEVLVCGDFYISLI